MISAQPATGEPVVPALTMTAAFEGIEGSYSHAVLEAYVEQDRTPPEMIADGFDPAVVAQVVRLVDGAEYKRRQMPPGVRITMKAFGKDRRMPITNRYRPLDEPSGPLDG